MRLCAVKPLSGWRGLFWRPLGDLRAFGIKAIATSRDFFDCATLTFSRHNNNSKEKSQKRLAVLYSLGYTLGVASEKRFSEVRKLLEKKGYSLTRISGSHHIFTKDGAPLVSIPVHSNKVKSYYVKEIQKLK